MVTIHRCGLVWCRPHRNPHRSAACQTHSNPLMSLVKLSKPKIPLLIVPDLTKTMARIDVTVTPMTQMTFSYFSFGHSLSPSFGHSLGHSLGYSCQAVICKFHQYCIEIAGEEILETEEAIRGGALFTYQVQIRRWSGVGRVVVSFFISLTLPHVTSGLNDLS